MISDNVSNCMDVLVVDDHPGVRHLLDIVIKESGHRVFTAQNGLEALEKVCDIRPQLIFMDVRMPLMGGLEALSKIKIMHPNTQVVIMTAYSSDATINQARKQGAICCIAKPFNVDDIRVFLDNLTCCKRDNIDNL